MDRGLLRESDEGGRFDAHTLVKEFAYERMGEGARRGGHMAAARYYRRHGEGYLDRLEMVHHLVLGARPEDAAEVLVDSGEAMIREGFFELLYALDQLEREKLDGRHAAWVHYLQGSLLLSLDDVEGSRYHLTRALELMTSLEGNDRNRLELRVHARLGEAEVAQYHD